ncbi:hypothetical protein DQ04_00221070 [Trypanosoma grayi]|uniref:hypothetical protein n=1 Tax=Trypanosoma grayi TaxID=71804 RepID=UPI0004F4B8C1|nr:hypothetical protein DQ04_00221070 [Trypanosoma grayi]KEG15004.1 hypothetical protein DQ04_00221070 [Trypanosoma grayi]
MLLLSAPPFTLRLFIISIFVPPLLACWSRWLSASEWWYGGRRCCGGRKPGRCSVVTARGAGPLSPRDGGLKGDSARSVSPGDACERDGGTAGMAATLGAVAFGRRSSTSPAPTPRAAGPPQRLWSVVGTHAGCY